MIEDLNKYSGVLKKNIFKIHENFQFSLLFDDFSKLTKSKEIHSYCLLERSYLYEGKSIFAPFFKIEKVESIVYDIIVLLEPTSPLRQSKDVEKAIKKLINTKLKSLWSVSKVDTKYNPLKQLKLEKSKLKYYDNKGKGVLFRQQLSDLYIRNGVVYVFTRDFIKKKKNLLDLETGYIVIDTPQISIDSNEDVGLVRYFLKN